MIKLPSSTILLLLRNHKINWDFPHDCLTLIGNLLHLLRLSSSVQPVNLKIKDQSIHSLSLPYLSCFLIESDNIEEFSLSSESSEDLLVVWSVGKTHLDFPIYSYFTSCSSYQYISKQPYNWKLWVSSNSWWTGVSLGIVDGTRIIIDHFYYFILKIYNS